jgi:beta-aspartyl-dipeptidase (metallo-type)
MFTILRNANVYAPTPLGTQDVLIADERIQYIAPGIPTPQGVGEVVELDLSGKLLVPGFIDQHVHIIGGGGEGGPATRTPEVQLSSVAAAGTTTIAGILGTDATTRSVETLLAKARALDIEGITTVIYTGAYQLPSPTITGSVRKDIALIDKVVGVGEIAISDHRSSQPQMEELLQVAAEARVGGLLGGKPGLVHLHVGGGSKGLTPLFELLEDSELPIRIFTPTHINRNRMLMEQGAEFARRGGRIDFTAGLGTSREVMEMLQGGTDPNHITLSSDGNGSEPRFDDRGNLVGLQVASLNTCYLTWSKLIREYSIPIDVALKLVTTNVANNLGLDHRKAYIKTGYDADLLVISQGLEIEQVWSRGRCLVRDGKPIVWGTFEHII